MNLVRHHDYDWVMVLHGRNRTGKTSLSVLALLTAEPELYEQVLCGIYEPTLARFAWTMDDMMDIALTLQRAALVYQEAIMLGREALKKWNLRYIRVMTSLAHRDILHINTFPRFIMLDPYLRDRSLTVARTYTRAKQRGYSRWQFRATSETTHDSGLRFAFDSMFRDAAKVVPELWALIREKEASVKDDILRKHGRTIDD